MVSSRLCIGAVMVPVDAVAVSHKDVLMVSSRLCIGAVMVPVDAVAVSHKDVVMIRDGV